ncbi:DBH-like monooxygenase protein 1 [Macrobrachium nipponense]|uniref:DBH-like monooxygenase protein 1 n=1 Tax=Macrobrachium nipponense TaxID=159736 RepID=UPI0030C80714
MAMQVREVAVWAWVWAARCCLLAYAWQQEAKLDEAGDLVLYWTADVKKNVLMIELQGRTLGYVAMGISSTGTMKNADLLIGFVDYKGTPHAVDYWSPKNGEPILDTSQDWKLVDGRQNESHTMIRARRPITPFTDDDINVTDFPTWILWAWHPHDPGEGQLPQYHKKNRGAIQLCLLRTDCWPQPPLSCSTTLNAAILLTLLFALLPRLL